VGATHPQDLKAIREAFPDIPQLMPGMGAQGGDIKAIIDACQPQRAPVLVNVSRGILYPENGLNFPDNIVEACENFQRKLTLPLYE
jgi:orotidine-5'-phosphate decarboxylase